MNGCIERRTERERKREMEMERCVLNECVGCEVIRRLAGISWIGCGNFEEVGQLACCVIHVIKGDD